MNLLRTLMAVVINNGDIFALLLVQSAYAGMALISKAALNDGMNPLVFNAYRQVIATLSLAPFAYFFERKKNTSMSFSIFCKIFLAALCGPTVCLDLYIMALHITSATYATAILNTIPVSTFIISIILSIGRMETFRWRSFYGALKILGIFITVGGAIVLSLYQGPRPRAPSPVGSSTEKISHNELKSTKINRIEGPVLVFLSAIAWSLWLIMQSKLLKIYPAMLRLSTLQCLLSSVQSTVVAAALERKLSSWKIEWDVQFASLAYCGVLVTGVSFGLQIWCINKKGPFYVAMFTPLALLITAIFSAFVWNERLSFESIMGGILIVGGFYCVLLGRRKEEENLKKETSGE